jgi:NAD-dependent DNA ligase
MIRGIGPVYAKKLLRAFGEKVFDVIEAEPDRLREVDGIGPVRAGRITAAWAEQKVVHGRCASRNSGVCSRFRSGPAAVSRPSCYSADTTPH